MKRLRAWLFAGTYYDGYNDGYAKAYQDASRAAYERQQRREQHARSSRPNCPICRRERLENDTLAE